MLSIILIAGVLVAVTVAVHVAGSTVLLKALRRWHAILPTRFWLITRLLVVVTWWLVLFLCRRLAHQSHGRGGSKIHRGSA
jgi:hypothetical protein